MGIFRRLFGSKEDLEVKAVLKQISTQLQIELTVDFTKIQFLCLLRLALDLLNTNAEITQKYPGFTRLLVTLADFASGYDEPEKIVYPVGLRCSTWDWVEVVTALNAISSALTKHPSADQIVLIQSLQETERSIVATLRKSSEDRG